MVIPVHVQSLYQYTILPVSNTWLIPSPGGSSSIPGGGGSPRPLSLAPSPGGVGESDSIPGEERGRRREVERPHEKSGRTLDIRQE